MPPLPPATELHWNEAMGRLSCAWALFLILLDQAVGRMLFDVSLEKAALPDRSALRIHNVSDSPFLSFAAIEDNLLAFMQNSTKKNNTFVDGVHEMLNKTLIPSVYKSMQADNLILYKSKKMFDACLKPRSKYMNGDISLHSDIDNINQQLRQCRKERKDKAQENKNCIDAQVGYEVAVCTEIAEVENINIEYTKCYDQAAKDLVDQEILVRSKEKYRYQEWETIKRIECLTKVLRAKGYNYIKQQAAIIACKKKKWDTGRLQLQYMAAPKRAPPLSLPRVPCERLAARKLMSPTESCKPCKELVNTSDIEFTLWQKPTNFTDTLTSYANEEGICLTKSGKTPEFKWHAASSWICQDLCDKDNKCMGFSSKLEHSECLLWMGSELKGGGEAWNGATCMIKQTTNAQALVSESTADGKL